MKAQVIAKRLLGSRLLRWVVVVLAVGIGGYKISEEWHDVSHSLGQIGVLACFEALLALLVAQFANLKVWQGLLAGLGSPLRLPVAGRILLIGQLGKYIPGSLWPILTQMELGAAAKVPRARSASASVLSMMLSLCVGLVIAMVTVPFAAVHSDDYLWVFILVPVIAVCFHPKVLNPLLNKLLKLARRAPLETPVTGRVLARALAWQFTASDELRKKLERAQDLMRHANAEGDLASSSSAPWISSSRSSRDSGSGGPHARDRRTRRATRAVLLAVHTPRASHRRRAARSSAGTASAAPSPMPKGIAARRPPGSSSIT